MNSNKTVVSAAIFPLAVSIILILVTGILAIIVFRSELNLFTSSFDRLLTSFASLILVILNITWLLILLFEGFDLSLGKLYKSAKWLLFFIYYPISKIVTGLFRIPRQDVQISFLAFQNRMFLPNNNLNKESRLLLLLPHCLQFHDCKIRITRDINSCEGCGECDICNLKDIGKRFELKIGIANGGTLARKIVNDLQPDAIIAVACHRDLTDGVRESWKYPVYAILNERPLGPCYDTKVDVVKVERIINRITCNTTEDTEKTEIYRR
jgi:hypothetical protein